MSPWQHVHAWLLLSFLTFWKKLGKKKCRTEHKWSRSGSHCPEVKIFCGWLLIEGSWEISSFLGKQGIISKEGLSEFRKLSDRARSVVTNHLWESGKRPESLMAPRKERANTSQLHPSCLWEANFSCSVIKSLLRIREREIFSDVVDGISISAQHLENTKQLVNASQLQSTNRISGNHFQEQKGISFCGPYIH